MAATECPPKVTGLPPCCEAKEEAEDSKASLHRKPALVGRFPLLEQCSVVEPKASRLLCHVDVQGGSREYRSAEQSELTNEHDDLLTPIMPQ
jgi:hypothetical protein